MLIRYPMVCGPECRQHSPTTRHTSILYDVTIQFQELHCSTKIMSLTLYTIEDINIKYLEDRRWCQAIH